MSMNRLHNIRNPHQGSAPKVLCVCSAGLLRSPTAAYVLGTEYGYNTRAVGLNEDYALIPVDNVLLYWADSIVCMNAAQKEELESRVKALGIKIRIINLDIPDSYPYMDPRLIELIKTRYAATGCNGKV